MPNEWIYALNLKNYHLSAYANFLKIFIENTLKSVQVKVNNRALHSNFFSGMRFFRFTTWLH
jgi:hypothetical protein